jgi:hypothetical protein
MIPSSLPARADAPGAQDALPTYGLIGALALSKQLSMTTDPVPPPPLARAHQAEGWVSSSVRFAEGRLLPALGDGRHHEAHLRHADARRQ